ncbi:hypothetical protein [Xanthobacter wiegelii]|nr:succinate dehydrogenase/fumarate reductase flavoprotein subunit [Xanthobacter flavus]
MTTPSSMPDVLVIGGGNAALFAENFAVYGVRKVWRQMIREVFP